MRNVKIIVEYDGSCYHGWQWQPNGRTIQEVLEEKISTITRESIKLTGSGRTDAGVHAVSQVANFRTKSKIGCSNLLRGINSLLPEDIVVKDLADVHDAFHARYDAKSKTYRYVIYNNPVRTALNRRYSWNVYQSLDVNAMEDALGVLVGTHDFSSFCGANDNASSHVRTIRNIGVEAGDDHMITISIEGDGFLRHMVRNIVGTLVDVGKGKITRDDFLSILKGKDRTKAGITAPAQGLFLEEVTY